MKKINWPEYKKWFTTAFFALAIVGLIGLVIWWQMNKKTTINETMVDVPKLQTTITAETLAELEKNADNEKSETETGETSLKNMSEVYGLTPTQAYLKMKNVEAQIKTVGDYLNMVTNYFDSLTTGDTWSDWKELVLEEEKVAYVQEKLAQTPRLNQLTEVTETIDLEMGRAFLTATTNDGQKVAVVMNLDLTNEGEKLWYVISESFVR